MWKSVYSYRAFGYAAIAAVFWLVARFARRKGENAMQSLASCRGYEYRNKIDPAELDLYATSFFGRFDTAEGVLSGVLDGTGFSRFVQRWASGHGYKTGSREVVAFEIGANPPDDSPRACSDGFTIEVSNGRAFMWREQDAGEEEEMDQFLARAHAACQLATENAGSNG